MDVIHRNANGEIYTRQLDMRRDELDGETRAAVDVMLRYGARSTDHARDKISTIKDDAKERVKAAQRQARREAMKRKDEKDFKQVQKDFQSVLSNPKFRKSPGKVSAKMKRAIKNMKVPF